MPPAPYDHDHENEITFFASTNFRNQKKVFGIKTDDRRRHIYIIGKTGMGKTTLIENMVVSDINAGHGLAYIDPHGDTAQTMLDFIPPHRINDVVYFNPADVNFPVGFNILEAVDKEEKKDLVANGLVGVFKKIWPDVWSPRMEHILNNTVRALLDAPGSTLLGINRILVDKEYRNKVVSVIQNPVVKSFWVTEYASFSEKYRIEAIAPVQNKVGQFLSSPIIRNIVAQVKSTIDMRDIMDNRKIFILNLAKGLIGEENSRLLGAMVITRLQLAAMERVDIRDEKDRQDFYLYVDEFQNFATDSFANILSEARKYRLDLIVAHQYIEQLDEKVTAAIFGNVGTIISFRVGGADAEFMEKEFTPVFIADDLVNLQKFDVYLKLMIDGAASEPFSATTLSPIAKVMGSADKVVRVSRERWSRSRADIEEKVLKWSGMGMVDEAGEGIMGVMDEEDEGIEEKLRLLEASSPKIAGIPAAVGGGDRPAKPGFEIACSVCGKLQKLTFEPDWSRPWYCKEHLEMKKAGTLPAMPRPPRHPEQRALPPMPPRFEAGVPAASPPPSSTLSLSSLGRHADAEAHTVHESPDAPGPGPGAAQPGTATNNNGPRTDRPNDSRRRRRGGRGGRSGGGMNGGGGPSAGHRGDGQQGHTHGNPTSPHAPPDAQGSAGAGSTGSPKPIRPGEVIQF